MSTSTQANNETGFEVAVIGMAGRFPGAKDIHEFWENLKEGRETISFFSEEELEKAGINEDVYRGPDYVNAWGVLEDQEFFDSSFFYYTPVEAECMDPQVRIFHECCWQALEHAGYDPSSYKRLIGLYAGASEARSWEAFQLLSQRTNMLLGYAATYLGKDYLCTRISYRLGLKGPSFTLQTACSTSLVAIHLACQALLNSECHIAMAGGVGLSHKGRVGYKYQEGMVGSKNGHCHAFDAAACGTVRGEGVGLVVLKLLDRARKDRDTIHAVIKGSAVNNDGDRKVGFTAPSIKGQAEVIWAAQEMAEVEPQTISYIETHGTGTLLGDPVEVSALKKVFESNRKQSCALGAVKANIGHLDAAAGVAGVIKTIMALKHRQIPPHANFETPNPEIDFENSPFYVNTELSPWEPKDSPLRAGVSSFGIGGTNAHIVMEEAPPQTAPPQSRELQLLLLSAKSEAALERIAANMAAHLENNPDVIFADAAYTLQVGRKRFRHRRMAVASDSALAVEALTGPTAVPFSTAAPNDKDRPVVFMFPGQGSQYENMGRDLYQKEPVFREHMDRCFNILGPIIGHDLKAILYPEGQPGDSPDINQTQITQPALFVFEYSLASLLMNWGVTPYAMTGHSIGEFVAACLAGVLTLEDALKLVCLRGKSMQSVPSGSMLSVPLPEEELEPFMDEGLSLAAVNTTARCVVSGPHDVVDVLEQRLTEKGHTSRRLHTSHAFHSKMMDPILEEFTAMVKTLNLNKPEIPYISNVTGTWINEANATAPTYYAKHLRETVRFADGIGELLKKEDALFVEIGPGKALSTFVTQHKDKKPAHLALSLIRHPKDNTTDDYFLLNKIGQLWAYGAAIDWKGYYGKEKRRRIPLPVYSFDRFAYPFIADFRELAAQSPDAEAGVDGAVSGPMQGRAPIDANMELAAPAAQQRPALSTPYAPPENETEKTMAAMFEQFLGIKPIGVLDNFYELGGDSLNAVQLANLIRSANINVTFQQLLVDQNIREICNNLEPMETPAAEPVAEEEAPVESAGSPADSASDLIDGISQQELESLLEPIDISDRLTGLLKESGAAGEPYDLAPAQMAYFMNPGESTISALIYYSHDFPPTLELTDIHEIVAAVLDRNPLVRSVVMPENGRPVIREYKGFPGIQLPVVDVSGYSPSCRKEILFGINRRLRQPIDRFDHVQFRAALVKTAPGSFKLVSAFSHLIFDGTSIGVLDNQLKHLAKSKERPRTIKPQEKHYRDYVRFLQEQNYDDADFDRYVNSQDYLAACQAISQNFTGGDIFSEVFDLDISNIPGKYKGHYEVVVLLTYGQFIRELIGIDKAPITFISNGRVYKDGLFTNMIGQFPDEVPVLLPFSKDRPLQQMIGDFIEYKRFIKEKNFNFYNYLMKGYMGEIGAGLSLSPFMFNSLMGSYDILARTRAEEEQRPGAIGSSETPFFNMEVMEDFYADKVGVRFTQNTGAPVRETLLKHFSNLLRDLK